MVNNSQEITSHQLDNANQSSFNRRQLVFDNVINDNGLPSNNNVYHNVSKDQYLKEMDSEKNGPLYKQPFMIEASKKFRDKINSLKQFLCSNCHHLWPAFTDQ